MEWSGRAHLFARVSVVTLGVWIAARGDVVEVERLWLCTYVVFEFAALLFVVARECLAWNAKRAEELPRPGDPEDLTGVPLFEQSLESERLRRRLSLVVHAMVLSLVALGVALGAVDALALERENDVFLSYVVLVLAEWAVAAPLFCR